MISDQSLTTTTTRVTIADCSPDRSSSTSITPTNAMISDRSLTTTKTNSSDRSSSTKQMNVSRKRPSIVFDEISADVSAASSSKKITNAMSQKTSRTTIMDYTSSDRSSSMKRRSSSSKPSVVVDETVAAGSSSSEQQIPKHHWWKHWSGTHVVRDEHFTKSGRAVWAGRIIFVLVLISVATILGILAYHFLTEDEYERAEKQFIYISERAQMEAKEGLLARRWAGVTMASIVGEMYPNKEQWPFVEWLGFERITTSMLNTSRGNDMGFVPFVDPPKLSEFEDFAKATYKKLGFPNNTGVSKEFGFGVWYKQNNVMPPVKYHDINATSLNFDSPYKVLAPIFRTDEGYHPVLLFNVHSQNFTGHAIDQLINCSHVREDRHRRSLLDDEIETNRNNTSTPSTPSMPPNRCGVITDIFENLKLGGLWSIANFLPIYPVQDPLTVVGYIPSIFIVHELLDNIFAKDISGIDAVFESDARSISYTIVEGKPIYVGEGQHYDRNFEIHKVTKQLIDPELYADGQEGVPKSFKFHLIPNKNFFVRTKGKRKTIHNAINENSFHLSISVSCAVITLCTITSSYFLTFFHRRTYLYISEGPLVASIAVVVGIVLTMLAFLFYDFFVRKEFHAKRELLQARRQFMRFVRYVQ